LRPDLDRIHVVVVVVLIVLLWREEGLVLGCVVFCWVISILVERNFAFVKEELKGHVEFDRKKLTSGNLCWWLVSGQRDFAVVYMQCLSLGIFVCGF
jgi:hypothetical protein